MALCLLRDDCPHWLSVCDSTDACRLPPVEVPVALSRRDWAGWLDRHAGGMLEGDHPHNPMAETMFTAAFPIIYT